MEDFNKYSEILRNQGIYIFPGENRQDINKQEEEVKKIIASLYDEKCQRPL